MIRAYQPFAKRPDEKPRPSILGPRTPFTLNGREFANPHEPDKIPTPMPPRGKFWSMRVGNHCMRWFLAFVIIALLCAADRAYMHGRNAELGMSVLRSGAAAVNREAANLLRQVRG
jgi:hypothetical protein